MKIKIKDKKKPITQMWCFKFSGYDSEIINKLNSGEDVEVEKKFIGKRSYPCTTGEHNRFQCHYVCI